MKFKRIVNIYDYARNNPLTFTAKAGSVCAGILGMGVAVKDAHRWGKLISYQNKDDVNANAGLNYFNNTQYLDNKSYMTARMKQDCFDCEISTTVRGTGAAVSGYSKGFMIGLARHIVPLTASAAAILLKGKKSLIGSAGLVLWGIYSAGKHSLSHVDHKL